MQTTKHWLITIAALLCSLAVSAHDFEVDGIYYNITSSTNLTVEVTYKGNYSSAYYNEYGGVVIIPSTVTYGDNTYQVTSIGDEAFESCNNLTSVTIPESVISIGEESFRDSYMLGTIIIPESVVSIASGAFYNTAWYRELPDGVVYINKILYDYKGSMPINTSIKIEEGTIGIVYGAFYNCDNLASITIPNSITSIPNNTFNGCTSLKSVIFQDGNKELRLGYKYEKISGSLSGNYSPLFEDCPIETLYIGRNIIYYSSQYTAFEYNKTLKSVVVGDSVLSIKGDMFNGCWNLTSIKIGKNVSRIGDAFDNCSSLKEIIFEDGEDPLFLDYQWYSSSGIGSGIFNNCPLKKVYIGRTLDFKTNKAYGYSPFYNKNIDTLIISKKQSLDLRLGSDCKRMELLYLDNDYSEIVPANLPLTSTLYYFNAPYQSAEHTKFKDIASYLKKYLNCKAQMVTLGEIQAGFESLTITLNDTLINPFNVAPSTNPNAVRYRAVSINGSYIIPDSANIYKCENLKMGTNYPVELCFSYNNKQYTASENIATKKINPVANVDVTLTTATIRYNVGDTIGLGKSISEIGVYYNNTHYPAEGKDEWHDLPYHTTIKNLYPGNSFNYQIYCKIDTNFYYSDWQYFNVKSPVINLVESKKCTQTTASLKVTGEYSDENISPVEIGVMSGYQSTWGGYKCDGKYVADENGNVLITGLKPDTTYVMTPYIRYNEDDFYPITGTNKNITTAGIIIACNSVAASATTITVEGMHDAGDATVIEYGFSDYEANTNRTTVTGLEPNSTYTLTYYVTTAEGGTLYQSVTAQTENLTFNTLKAKATSNTRAVICAEANIANEESGTGFEWRRMDAPDLVPSEVVGCAVHDSIMEGVLSNLSASTYYKYRPFYTSASGQSYYGEWIGFGTADAYVYFTPTVHTYATATASANAIRLTGYVLPGSDDIVEQGFEYWAESSATRSSNVIKVTANGQRMSVLLENLEPGTRYKYRAFATTKKETIYGEIQMFETPAMTDVEEMTFHSEPIISSRRGVIYIDNMDENCIVRVFTLSGAKIYEGDDREISVESGIYIIHADAITHKLVVK